MSEHSPIGWTDATWPIVAGCEYVSPGCSNCWAVRDSWRLAHNPHRKVSDAYFGTVDKTDAGKLVWSGIVRELPARLNWPLKWRGHKRVFVCSQADLFHRKVSNQFIAAAFGVMAACPQHTFQVLTKNSTRMLEWFRWLAAQQNGAAETCAWEARYLIGSGGHASEPVAWPLENVWIGVTVEDQRRAEERIPDLHRSPAAKRWLSVEPMLEAIDLTAIPTGIPDCENASFDLADIDWVVCGGARAGVPGPVKRNFAYMHGLCGKPAFFMDDWVVGLVGTSSHNVELPDGTKPLPGSYMVCGSCGEALGRLLSSNVKPWTPA